MSFMFVPGPLDIKGDDRADSLARCAPVEKEKAKDRDGSLNAFGDACRDECSRSQLGSILTSRTRSSMECCKKRR